MGGIFWALKYSKIAEKFSLFLLLFFGSIFSGISKAKIWLPRFISGGGGFSLFWFIDFLLEDLASPPCFSRIKCWPTFTNSCWFRCGWGFFFLGWEIFLALGGEVGWFGSSFLRILLKN